MKPEQNTELHVINLIIKLCLIPLLPLFDFSFKMLTSVFTGLCSVFLNPLCLSSFLSVAIAAKCISMFRSRLY